MTDSDEQKKCFHYTNLQPMWAPEIPMSSAQEDLLQQRVGEQDDRVQSILRHVGVKS